MAKFTKTPNRIVEVYGNFKTPQGANCALVKLANGDAYYVAPAAVEGKMPRVGQLLDTTKHERRLRPEEQALTSSPYPKKLDDKELLAALERGGHTFEPHEFQRGGALLVGHTKIGLPIYQAYTWDSETGAWEPCKLFGGYENGKLHLDF